MPPEIIARSHLARDFLRNVAQRRPLDAVVTLVNTERTTELSPAPWAFSAGEVVAWDFVQSFVTLLDSGRIDQQSLLALTGAAARSASITPAVQ